MTSTRMRVLQFIQEFYDTKGYCASLDEIAEGVGLASKSTSFAHVERLIFDGLLEQEPNVARSIRPTSRRHGGCWFKSSEVLPPGPDKVLVCVRGEVRQGWFGGQAGGWMISGAYYLEEDVTHWRPLPPAPAEGRLWGAP